MAQFASAYDEVCANANRVFKHYLGDPVGKSYRDDMYFTCHECEKPKLGVNEHKRVAHCFACGWKGNAVKLIQERENLNVKQAIALGFEIIGQTPPPEVRETTFSRPSVPAKGGEVYEEMKHSIYFSIYYYFLRNNESSGNYYKHHLLEVPVTNTNLVDIIVSSPHLNVVDELKRTYPISAIESCPGFVRTNGEVQFYLENHIIFPYWDAYGRYIVAFNGRRKPNTEKGPRYKWMIGERKHLYFPPGVTHTNVEVITEGEKKAITATMMGVPTVGVSGVDCYRVPESYSLNPESGKLYICYDNENENAAVRKSERNVVRFIEKERTNIYPPTKAKIVKLPQGYKLDTYLKEYGIDAFKNLLRSSDV